jgi:hypothetical protein
LIESTDASAANAVFQYAPLVLSTVAALGSAVITGIIAATLKHRWDVAGELRAREWEERRQRQKGLVEAFADYLVTRPSRAHLDSLFATTSPGQLVGLDRTMSSYRLATTRLLILLTTEDARRVVEADRASVEQWVHRVWKSPGTGSDIADPDFPEDLVRLARSIATFSPTP